MFPNVIVLNIMMYLDIKTLVRYVKTCRKYWGMRDVIGRHLIRRFGIEKYIEGGWLYFMERQKIIHREPYYLKERHQVVKNNILINMRLSDKQNYFPVSWYLTYARVKHQGRYYVYKTIEYLHFRVYDQEGGYEEFEIHYLYGEDSLFQIYHKINKLKQKIVNYNPSYGSRYSYTDSAYISKLEKKIGLHADSLCELLFYHSDKFSEWERLKV